ncbi:MAG: K(+)-transporting ATPase subunit F [Longimicrobiales bacterium]
MSIFYAVGAVLAVLLLAYLVVALLNPERFS